MKTEQEIKEQITPEIIKKMVELAEGFDYIEESEHDVDYLIWNNKRYFTSSDVLFPLLIHRAVEGWNKTSGADSIIIYGDRVESVIDWNLAEYFFPEYQSENLTLCDCACLDCLIEVLK